MAKLQDWEVELIKGIQKRLDINYELNEEEKTIPDEMLDHIVEDLKQELDSMDEKYEKIQKDIEENYELKKFDPYDFYGVSESNFH